MCNSGLSSFHAQWLPLSENISLLLGISEDHITKMIFCVDFSIFCIFCMFLLNRKNVNEKGNSGPLYYQPSRCPLSKSIYHYLGISEDNINKLSFLTKITKNTINEKHLCNNFVTDTINVDEYSCLSESSNKLIS